MTDQEIRDAALREFKILAPRKFNAGIAEHNPDGTKGMWLMTSGQLVDSAEEEVIDLWHYIQVLKAKIKEQDALILQLKRTIANKHNER